MSKKLKDTFNSKMDVKPSNGFDSAFFSKLEKAQKKPKLFSHWISWAVSGCATASVLFFAVTNYNVPSRSQQQYSEEYIQSVIEIQDTLNEGITSDEAIDLTSADIDAI